VVEDPLCAPWECQSEHRTLPKAPWVNDMCVFCLFVCVCVCVRLCVLFVCVCMCLLCVGLVCACVWLGIVYGVSCVRKVTEHTNATMKAESKGGEGDVCRVLCLCVLCVVCGVLCVCGMHVCGMHVVVCMCVCVSRNQQSRI